MDARLKKLITQKPLHWTEHARFKMRQYGLSEARVKRVLRAPSRVEAGIAPKTVAVMAPGSNNHPALGKRPASPADAHTSASLRLWGTRSSAGKFPVRKKERIQEIWCMYQDTPKKRKIIAAWRYPGVSPVRQPPPFPDDLM